VTTKKLKLKTKPVRVQQTYAWREGYSFSRLNPQKCGERILKIARAHNGNLEPWHVVEDAMDSDSPLHNGFEWDNDMAAEKYRLEQARLIVRSIRVVYEKPTNGNPGKISRLFVHVQNPDENEESECLSAYVTTDRLLANPRLRQQAVEEAHILLLGVKHRFKELSELGAVFHEIDKLGRKIAADRIKSSPPMNGWRKIKRRSA
jgi:hypothetical protein